MNWITLFFSGFDSILFWEKVLNGMDVTNLAVYMLYFGIGVLWHFFLDADKSARYDPEMPKNFSPWFAFKDNIKRFIFVVLAIFINVVLYKELNNGNEITLYAAFMNGYSLDSMIGHGTYRTKTRAKMKSLQKQFQDQNNG